MTYNSPQVKNVSTECTIWHSHGINYTTKYNLQRLIYWCNIQQKQAVSRNYGSLSINGEFKQDALNCHFQTRVLHNKIA